ncbi:MAG: hypothetical protein ACK4MV_12590 [Beijerinckiaceae bacterium]
MTKQLPPVPPGNRSPKGAHNTPKAERGPDPKFAERARNLEQQGRQGDIRQNTTHQGQRQDR